MVVKRSVTEEGLGKEALTGSDPLWFILYDSVGCIVRLYSVKTDIFQISFFGGFFLLEITSLF